MIYVIDDDNRVNRGYQLLLKSTDLESLAFDSVEEFLKCWKPSAHDVLILDMQMPGMNGMDLLAYLMQNALQLPVIVVTAYDSEKSREQAKKYGVLAYLRKPADGNAIIDLINYSLKTA